MPSLRHTLWPEAKKGLGQPLFVEEDGPILGIVDDVFLDSKSGQPLAYRVLASGQYLEMPAEAVQETPGGLVYRSPWFSEAEKLIRKLESHELLIPELFLASTAVSDHDRQMIEAAIAKSPVLKKEVEEARRLYKDVLPKIEALEKEKFKLVGEAAELTEGVATSRLDTQAYRERFVGLKRRLQVIEASLRRAETVRTRLERMPWVVARPWNGSNGHALPTGEGPSGPQALPVPGNGNGGAKPAVVSAEDWRRIKKFRVLRAEKDLQERESRLKDLQSQVLGTPDEVAAKIARSYAALEEVRRTRGEEAYRAELGKLLQATTPPSATAKAPSLPGNGSSSTSGSTEAPPASTGPRRGHGSGKTCPLCSEPLKGGEKSCPGCGADLSGAEPAPKNASGPGGVQKFVRGGGAVKLGSVLLLAAGVLALLAYLLR